MSRYFVTPLKPEVPKPDGTSLAEGGEMLPADRWWKRRERDGDVETTAEAPRSTAGETPRSTAVKAVKKEA